MFCCIHSVVKDAHIMAVLHSRREPRESGAFCYTTASERYRNAASETVPSENAPLSRGSRRVCKAAIKFALERKRARTIFSVLIAVSRKFGPNKPFCKEFAGVWSKQTSAIPFTLSCFCIFVSSSAILFTGTHAVSLI